MKKIKRFTTGFSLIEMLLVLVIMSSIVVMVANYTQMKADSARRDRAALQMQQILNAGLVYYVSQGMWPTQTLASGCPGGTSTLSTLTGTYLPATMNSPYVGKSYAISCNTQYGTFSVQLTTTNTTDASMLAGILPSGTVQADGLTVSAQVSVPGQNLNNARSVNFAGIYHNGACVPAPICPGTMSPDILVVPVSMYGVNGVNSASPSPPTTYYPIEGFTAYAVGVAGTSPPSSLPGAYINIAPCNSSTSGTAAVPCSGGATAMNQTANYWRVCLSVTTSQGNIPYSATDSTWGQYVTVMAITRCIPANENSGSDFTVWTQ
jgi:prepilin-type N-terminal cleavage/methylation domain-containing protein